jgi:hypothetical protein
MANGIGALRRQAMMAWLAGQSATAPGAWSIGIWGADPGEDGQSGTEVSATGYTRASPALANNTGWSTPTTGTTTTMSNTVAQGYGTWTGGSPPYTAAYVAIWRATGTTASDFVARAVINSGTPISVTAGSTVSIAAGALSLSMTFT